MTAPSSVLFHLGVVAATDSDDFFGQLEEAKAVTDDQTDSVQVSIEQTGADARRADADTTANQRQPRSHGDELLLSDVSFGVDSAGVHSSRTARPRTTGPPVVFCELVDQVGYESHVGRLRGVRFL